MVKYSCEKCGKEFSQKSHYDTHMKKKRPCINNADKIKELVEKAVSEKINELSKDVIKSEDKIKFIDLFAGTGAFSLALESSNKYECIFSNDMIESSKKIYNLNNSHLKLTLKDLNNIDVNNIPEHDLLCGGFPCQPFSIAGEQKGFNDERSNVFWKILEILKKHSPNMIILENVKNLKSHDKGNTYKTIYKELEKLGYFLKSNILDTSKITNIPQHRERIYIVGFRNKQNYEKFNFDFPIIKNLKIEDFLEKEIIDKYYYTDKFKVFEDINNTIKKDIYETNTLYQYRRYYTRENKNNCCPTLTANMGSGGHNVPLLKDKKGIRKLTPRECFNLQGFPRDYKLPDLSDSALYHLAGNAVSVPVVKLIVDKIVNL